jgi:hypothetical protein
MKGGSSVPIAAGEIGDENARHACARLVRRIFFFRIHASGKAYGLLFTDR